MIVDVTLNLEAVVGLVGVKENNFTNVPIEKFASSPLAPIRLFAPEVLDCTVSVSSVESTNILAAVLLAI